MRLPRELLVSAAVVVVLAFAPWISPLFHLDLSIVSTVLVVTIAVMSVNLLLGYTGLPAFGNAAYFGLGAYGAGAHAPGESINLKRQSDQTSRVALYIYKLTHP